MELAIKHIHIIQAIKEESELCLCVNLDKSCGNIIPGSFAAFSPVCYCMQDSLEDELSELYKNPSARLVVHVVTNSPTSFYKDVVYSFLYRKLHNFFIPLHISDLNTQENLFAYIEYLTHDYFAVYTGFLSGLPFDEVLLDAKSSVKILFLILV